MLTRAFRLGVPGRPFEGFRFSRHSDSGKRCYPHEQAARRTREKAPSPHRGRVVVALEPIKHLVHVFVREGPRGHRNAGIESPFFIREETEHVDGLEFSTQCDFARDFLSCVRTFEHETLANRIVQNDVLQVVSVNNRIKSVGARASQLDLILDI